MPVVERAEPFDLGKVQPFRHPLDKGHDRRFRQLAGCLVPLEGDPELPIRATDGQGSDF